MDIKLQNKIKNFLGSHNYSISDNNFKLLTNKLYNSKLFNNYDEEFNFVQNGGGNVLPAEYFGVDTKAYVNSNAGTNTAPTNAAIRPEITSEIFPMNGGACPCMIGGMFKGCAFITNSDMKNFKQNNLLNFNNKELKENKEFLNNKLNIYLHDLMNNVKNKNMLIGKSHINMI